MDRKTKNLLITIIETIKVFITMSLQLMFDLLKYILPFLVFVLAVSFIALKFNWKGMSVIIFIVTAFFILLLGPPLLYKIIADDNNIHLPTLSLYIAVQTIVILWIIFHKRVRL
jgi:hypothetical protein